jgi:uncharacterized protein with PIN domain
VAKLYLDEHLGDLADDLRATGHDVIAASEPGRRQRTDAWHVREAVSEWRVLLTLNRSDFLYLHQLWTTLETMASSPGQPCRDLDGDSNTVV